MFPHGSERGTMSKLCAQVVYISMFPHGSEGNSVHFPYSFHGSEGRPEEMNFSNCVVA